MHVQILPDIARLKPDSSLTPARLPTESCLDDGKLMTMYCRICA